MSRPSAALDQQMYWRLIPDPRGFAAVDAKTMNLPPKHASVWYSKREKSRRRNLSEALLLG
jgi:hypothetical protein